MLSVNNIEVIYGQVILVLKGISLTVNDRSIVALLGSNGGGKTTVLKAISGLLKVERGAVTNGSIVFDGERIDKKQPQDIFRMGITQVIEGRRIFEYLTVHENLMLAAHLRSDRAGIKKDLELVYEYFPKLSTLRHQAAGYLSGGEAQMVVIGRALMARPKLMLLDEPSLGLGPVLVNEIFAIIERVNREQNMAILLVEQNALSALSIANYGYVMENGMMVLDGPAQKLRENEDIKEFYLGLSELGQRKSYREMKHYKRRKRWLG